MTASAAVTLIIKTFIVLSVLLLVGTFLRAKVKLFQNLYLPACVIGGFLGLLLGPKILGLLPVPEDMMAVISSLPGILFTPIIAALPICSAPFDGAAIKKQKVVLIMTVLLCLVGSIQFGTGLFVNAGFSLAGFETYRSFGLELAQGFIGGHGQAGATGGMLQALNQPYWETAQGVVSTTATVGLIGGLVLGIVLLNIAARKGYTTIVKQASDVPLEMRTGYYAKGQKRPGMGEQTTITNSIETLTLHLAVLLLATGAGYVIAGWLNRLNWSLLGALATWIYALFAMYIIWFIIRKCKIEHLFDEKVKNTVTGLLSDYLIVAAITSIPIKVVISYWAPLLTMCVLGLIITPSIVWFFSKRFIGDYWVERSLGPLGCLTGVFITGMLLIKMADPDFKTPAINDYSLAYTLHNFYMIPLVAAIFPFVVSNGAVIGGLGCLVLTVVWFVLLLLLGRNRPAVKQ